ncbi:hypothetical protein BaRGS_00035908 [Batillaria attramentaria]|uniref:Uncharacterized protein n=1 Tax=Batillaria attramentaria TaxID=370345 RepID=A0ABD0JD75_9CAEN
MFDHTGKSFSASLGIDLTRHDPSTPCLSALTTTPPPGYSTVSSHSPPPPHKPIEFASAMIKPPDTCLPRGAIKPALQLSHKQLYNYTSLPLIAWKGNRAVLYGHLESVYRRVCVYSKASKVYDLNLAGC